jgi:hypothetical protein
VAETIGDEGLFFLLRGGDPQPEFDIVAVPEEQKLGLYHTTSPQGLLLNDQGRVRVARYSEPGFPTDLDGTQFAELMDEVRSIAG